MSPEDELLSRTMLYVGLGVAAVCLIVAWVVEIRMVRKGKVTRKDVWELLACLAIVAVFAWPDIVGALRTPGELPKWIEDYRSSVFAVACVLIFLSVLPWLIHTGTAAVGAASRGRLLRGAVVVLAVAAGIAALTLNTIGVMPRSWILRAIVLFIGSAMWLVARGLQLARAECPEPPEAESLIIKASS
jgi:hypothetical protein